MATMNAICGVSSLLVTYYVDALNPQYAENGTFQIHLNQPRDTLSVVLTRSAVIAIVAYGDETYVPFQAWNVGNCTVGAGVSCSMRHIDPFLALSY